MGADPTFAIDFDFVDHRLVVATTDGFLESFAIPGNSVASFYLKIMTLLGDLGVIRGYARSLRLPTAEDSEQWTFWASRGCP